MDITFALISGAWPRDTTTNIASDVGGVSDSRTRYQLIELVSEEEGRRGTTLHVRYGCRKELVNINEIHVCASFTKITLSTAYFSSSFSICQGRCAARNVFTASSDSLFHPPLSLVFFFQSSSSPAFLTSLLIYHVRMRRARVPIHLVVFKLRHYIPSDAHQYMLNHFTTKSYYLTR